MAGRSDIVGRKEIANLMPVKRVPANIFYQTKHIVRTTGTIAHSVVERSKRLIRGAIP